MCISVSKKCAQHACKNNNNQGARQLWKHSCWRSRGDPARHQKHMQGSRQAETVPHYHCTKTGLISVTTTLSVTANPLCSSKNSSYSSFSRHLFVAIATKRFFNSRKLNGSLFTVRKEGKLTKSRGTYVICGSHGRLAFHEHLRAVLILQQASRGCFSTLAHC